MQVRWKRTAETLLSRAMLPNLARAWNRGRAVVLAYHNIVPDGEPIRGDRSLHLPRREFARQLDSLQRTHDVVPLAALLDGRGPNGRPRAAITFDDAYCGAVTCGAAEVAQRGLPATILVAPGLLGGRPFWWDELANPRTGMLEDGIRQRGLDQFAGQGTEIRRWALAAGMTLQSLPSHATAATEEDLQRVAAQPGITLASHTWSHPNLQRLDPSTLEDELGRPLAWLRTRFSQVVPWLAYPYGLTAAAVARAVQAAGYDGALLVSGGWLPRRGRQVRRHAIPRLNVPAGLSMEGFALRAAGLGLW